MNTEQERNEIPDTFRDHWEWRRFRAWELHVEGWSQVRIAEALSVTGGAVSQWLKQVREQGLGALRSRREESGRRPGLTEKDLAHLEVCLKRGPEAYGFRGEVWTQPRVREVIQKEFAITYTPRHVGRLLKQIGWTRQKPTERADQRDEDAVTEWRAETLPELKKKPPGKTGPSFS
jgi:transposase